MNMRCSSIGSNPSGFDIQAFLLELETLSMQLQRKQTLGQMAQSSVVQFFFNIECNYYLLYSYIYMYQCSMCKYVYDCIYLSCQPLIHSCWLGGSLDIRLPFAHNVSPLDMLACPGKCSEVTVRYEIDFFLPGKYARRHCRSWLFLA